MAPLRRPGLDPRRQLHGSIGSAAGHPASAKSRMWSSTALELSVPFTPPGWKRAKSSGRKPRWRLTATRQRIAQCASIAVVLVSAPQAERTGLFKFPQRQHHRRRPAERTGESWPPRRRWTSRRTAAAPAATARLRSTRRFATRKHDVVRMNSTEIAVERFGRMQECACVWWRRRNRGQVWLIMPALPMPVTITAPRHSRMSADRVDKLSSSRAATPSRAGPRPESPRGHRRGRRLRALLQSAASLRRRPSSSNRLP